MGLFDWVGKKKREEEWMAQPRRLPSGVDKFEDGDTRWIMSHEFANDKNKNIRIYLAARKHGPDDPMWTVSLYKTDLKRDMGENIYTEYDTDITGDALDVVRALSEFDRQYKHSDDYVPVDGHRGTYRSFANKFGIHFDDDGNIMKVEKDTRVTKGTFMNRESIDDLFHKAANKTPEIDTWEEVYEQLVDKWPAAWTVFEEKLVPAKVLEAVKPEPAKIEPVKPEDITAPAAETPSSTAEAKPVVEAPKAEEKPVEPVVEAPAEPKFDKVIIERAVTLDDLSKHSGYARFAADAKPLMARLKKLPEDLRSSQLTRRQKEQVIAALVEPYYTPADEKSVEVRLAARLRNATILVGLVRAGSELYDDFAKGKFSADGMTLMSTVGAVASNLAAERLGVEAVSAKKIADIIAKGKDPNGAGLPLEKVFVQFPPPAYTPVPEKPAAPPAAAKKPPSSKRDAPYNSGW